MGLPWRFSVVLIQVDFNSIDPTSIDFNSIDPTCTFPVSGTDISWDPIPALQNELRLFPEWLMMIIPRTMQLNLSGKVYCWNRPTVSLDAHLTWKSQQMRKNNLCRSAPGRVARETWNDLEKFVIMFHSIQNAFSFLWHWNTQCSVKCLNPLYPSYNSEVLHILPWAPGMGNGNSNFHIWNWVIETSEVNRDSRP